MYQLFHDKEKYKIEIKPLKKIFEDTLTNITADEIYYHNTYYYFCKSRKPLKEIALKMKEVWFQEAEEHLQKVKDIKV